MTSIDPAGLLLALIVVAALFTPAAIHICHTPSEED